MNKLLRYESYKTAEKPKNLVLFLHGYNGNLEDHKYAIDWLRENLNSAYLITPEAPQVCDKNSDKRQWFGMLKYDPQKIRNNPNTPTKDIFKIYNAAQTEIDLCANEINLFINEMQQKFHIDDKHTFIIGFSQGAMLAIYTSLTRSSKIAGAFSLSGLVAGGELLKGKISSHPNLYMMHGKDDLKVQYKTLASSLSWLRRHGISVNSRSYKNLAHHINKDEIELIAKIIN